MTKKDAKKRLESKGYHLTYNASGTITATKGQKRYTTDSLNGLIKKIFK